jgi:pimeloyl-ACP methyl ester carboxylesterase
MTSSDITLSDGRVLCVHEFGDPAGRPVVFFHGGGLGATGLFAASCDRAAREQHLRVLAPDRPGLGGSSPCLGRTVLDWPRDVAAMGDALQIEAFPVVAHSGGAAYALACAWQLRDRVSALHLTSTMASRPMVAQDRMVPYKTKLSMWWFAAMPDFLLRAMFRKIADGMKHAPEKTSRAFLRRLPACERSVLAAADHQALLRDCVASALAQGTAAAVADLHLILGEWGIPLQEVRQPVTMWHGEHDATALPQSARTLAGTLSAAQLRVVPEAGHLTTWLCHAPDVLGGV